ncbi:glycosyl hydrolase family 17 protein [Gracilinema caldarium]|uniref:glycosyl hydrolase family 17 protein n=1 Tax=Gracilinema caldarium TaxID=215591 RepID=UPI0026EED301|nr:glycosyl hydrolase family 17 protein [Gracilinema caldarium]
MKNSFFPYGNAICYSGYRTGQRPGVAYPSYQEVLEDLIILQGHWQYLRLYDCTPHADVVLQVIRQEQLPVKVMLGAYIEAEINNPQCPWGGIHDESVLRKNRTRNEMEIQRLITLAHKYKDIIIAVSVGNEATVDWNDHMVPVERVVQFARQVKAAVTQPVTFCENYVPWIGKLAPLVDVVDFISIHTYPEWEQKPIVQALDYTKENYYLVANHYPDKPVVITEAGWTTASNGRGIPPDLASEENQKQYINELMAWSAQMGIVTFVFEAFDEAWKGSDDPLEPEKHWGLYSADRKPKLVVK